MDIMPLIIIININMIFLSPQGNNSQTWIIAVVVLGCALAFAILIIILCSCRKLCNRGSGDFTPLNSNNINDDTENNSD